MTKGRRATIADVAHAAGVSPATVSRVLNKNPTVAPELVERVERAVQEGSYRPNVTGRALRRQKADMWAAIVPDLRNPFFHTMVHAFEHVAHAHGYSVVLSNSQEDLEIEQSAIETVVDHQISGALIAVVSPEHSRLDIFEDAGIPVVTVDRRVPRFRGDSVHVDNERIGSMAAQHLLDTGWRNPLVVSHTADLPPLRDREAGFLAELERAGTTHSGSRRIRLTFEDIHKPGVMDAAIADLDGIDAIFAVTNSLTALAYRSLRGLGHAIGQDVGLIGVDDDQWNAMVDPGVTVIQQKAAAVGMHAAELLLVQSNGLSEAPESLSLEPVLTVRGSTNARRPLR